MELSQQAVVKNDRLFSVFSQFEYIFSSVFAHISPVSLF